MSETVLPASLQERIAQEQYQPASAADLPDGVTIEDDGGGTTAGFADGPQPGYEQGTSADLTPDTPQPVESPAATEPPVNAVLQQMQQQLLALRQDNESMRAQQRLAQIQQAEIDFANSIQHLPPAQQEAALARHEMEQLQPVLQYQQQLIQQMQGQQQQSVEAAQASEEMVAKRMVAWHRAVNAGLDPSNPLIFSILTGEDVKNPADMDARIQQFIALGAAGGRRIVAGGERAVNAGARAPKRGSGDLMGLINSRSYELTPAE